MGANELRIGNYVYDTLGKVNKIDLEAITYIAKEPHNQVKPIPLTEEWLLKFGFQKYKTRHNTYKIQSFIIEEGLLKDSPYCFRKRINNENSIELAYIKYIHQLQNIYFALTGEELTLNQNKMKQVENPEEFGAYICRMDDAYIKMCYWNGQEWLDMWKSTLEGKVINWIGIPINL